MRPSVVTIADTKAVGILRRIGYRSVFLDERLAWDAILLADAPIEVDLHRWEDVEARLSALHARAPILAVVATRPGHVPLAAYLAARFDLPGLGLAAALNCSNLMRTRRALEASGIPTGGWLPALDPEGAVWCAGILGMPVVLRTSERVSGEDAFVCHDLDAVHRAALRLATQSPVLLVEEFEPGPVFIALTAARRGGMEILAIFEAAIGAAPRNAIVAIRHPPTLSSALQTAIMANTHAALTGLRIDCTLASIHLRAASDGSLKVLGIDVGVPAAPLARLSEVVTGVDLTRAAVELALGRPLERRLLHAHRASVLHRLWFEQAGTLEYRYEVERRAATDAGSAGSALIQLEATPGTAILPWHHPDARAYGWILASGDDHPHAMRRYSHALDLLALRPSPVRADFARESSQGTAAAKTAPMAGPEADRRDESAI